MGNLGRPADATVPEPLSFDDAKSPSDAQPTSARVSAPPSTERIRRRAAVDRQWALPQVFGFVFVGWSAFAVLDVYVAAVTGGASISGSARSAWRGRPSSTAPASSPSAA